MSEPSQPEYSGWYLPMQSFIYGSLLNGEYEIYKWIEYDP